MARNFQATVKDSEGDKPCSVHFEAFDDIGTNNRTVVLRLQPGTTSQDAQVLAAVLNDKVRAIELWELYAPTDQTFPEPVGPA